MSLKKNVLFIMPSLTAGGGQKSLINLLHEIDYECFHVDLFLFNHEGLFMNEVPPEVQIIPLQDNYKRFASRLHKSISSFLARGNYSLAYMRLIYSMNNRRRANSAIKEQKGWAYLSHSIQQLNKKYDVAIGFLEKSPIYFCVDKVDADVKIGWIHNDYDKLEADPNFDKTYFEQLNHIVTVSGECERALHQVFPNHKDKVRVIHNIVSPKAINNLANDHSECHSPQEEGVIHILSIGRLHAQKNFKLAILSCKELVKRGYNICWRIIGEGEERKELAECIQKNGLENHFKLIGLRSNPYPYIKQSDIYVQTSKFEGKSIAIDEAKILSKPIVVTNFSTASDQIQDGINGLIVEMNAGAVADGIERIIKDSSLKNKLVSNLRNEELSTEREIHKLYDLVGVGQ